MKNRLTFKGDVSPLLKLAMPLALNGLVQSAVWFFETLFLARLGEQTLAAGSLVSWLFGTVAVILYGILSSINILVSHKHGEKDQHGIALIARDGMLLAVLLTIPAFILFWNMSPIFLLFGQSETVVALAKPYLHALSWGLLADFIAMAFLEVIMGVGRARIILLFTVITVVLNILCSYIFIFGKYGFPALGIAGAGWGMTISYWMTAGILIIFVLALKDYRNYFRHIFNFHGTSYLLELLQIGIPMGVMYCVEVAFFFALTLVMGIFGSEIQAANQVALQYVGLFMSMMFSIAQAVTVRMGHLLGAKEMYSAKKASHIGVGIAVTITGSAAIFYWLCPQVLISIDFDVNNPVNFGIVNEITKLLMVSAIFQILESARISLFGSLRGIKDTKFTLLTSFISFWCIALPIGYFLATRLHFDGVGLWWAMVLGAGFSVVLLQWRFTSRMNRLLKAAG